MASKTHSKYSQSFYNSINNHSLSTILSARGAKRPDYDFIMSTNMHFIFLDISIHFHFKSDDRSICIDEEIKFKHFDLVDKDHSLGIWHL